MSDILAIDVGTTAFKMGVFTEDLELRENRETGYEVNVYGQGKADIEPEKWWQALTDCAAELKKYFSDVRVISLSVTTPGLVPMDKDGTALGPAILFFDRRSQTQAARIRQAVGEDKLLEVACNLPVTGGSSLCSLMWIHDEQPEIWNATARFGHTNTYMIKRLTGEWSIDPSTVSITGMYDTREDRLTWFDEVLEKAGLTPDHLPELRYSYQSAGTVLPEVARELGVPEDCQVLCGGNDAVLAALSAGLKEPGEIVDIAGTCEIISICLSEPIGSPDYNIRSHVLPDRWVTLFVLNTGGKALEWFHSVFCREMTPEKYYGQYLPEVIEDFLKDPEIDLRDVSLPEYVPYLQGSRYSLDPLKAGFDGLSLESTRETFLLSMLKGNFRYLRGHLTEVGEFMNLRDEIVTTGGGAKIPGMNELKARWMGDYAYRYQEQSSLMGAAMLGNYYLTNRFG